jgi:hypothetical protein
MGHGAWMGIAWGTWKMGGWSRNIAPKTLHVLRAHATKSSKQTLGYPPKLDMFQWVVGFEVLVWRLMFCGTWFSTSWNECRATIETWHVSMLVCPRVPTAHVWKLVSSHLEASDTFVTCRWNNVEVRQYKLQCWASLHSWYYAHKEPYMRGSLATRVLVSL